MSVLIGDFDGFLMVWYVDSSFFHSFWSFLGR
jgi:hypothetical protein